MKNNVRYGRDQRDEARENGLPLFTIDIDDPVRGRMTVQGAINARDARALRRMLVRLVTKRCRVCGCTDADCRRCVAKTGGPCGWRDDLATAAGPICSACVKEERPNG